MVTLFIDDGGVYWPAEPDTIMRRFGGHLKGRGSLPTQAMALGFVFLDVCPAGTRIALLPPYTTRRAISRLAVLLAGHRAERVALSTDRSMRTWELIHGAGTAIQRVHDLVVEAHDPLPRPLIGTTVLETERVHEISGGRLLGPLHRWSDAGGSWSSEIYGQLQRLDVLENTIVCSKPRESDRFVIDWWGKRRDLFGAAWCKMAPGRELLEQPNRLLGEWNAVTLSRVISGSQPHLIACDVVARTPAGQLVRRTFKRLLLAWHTVGGVVVTVIDVGQSTITLEQSAAGR